MYTPRVRAAVFVTVASLGTASLFACRTETSTSSAATDAGVAEEDAAADAAPASGCPGATPTTYAWAPPRPKEDVCTDDDLDALASAISAKSLTGIEDIRSALGPACAACAVGRVDDLAWKAIVDGHEGYIGNVGGCVVHLGAPEACGKATDELSTCLIVGCDGCEGRKAQDTCADTLTAVDGACAGYLKTMRSTCTSGAIGEAFSSTGTCQSFVETVRLFCGPKPPQDAGTD